MTGRLAEAGYAAGWAFVRALPEPAAAAAFRVGADLVYRRGGKAVDRLRSNLSRVAPEADLDALTRAGVRSYARYWCEVFRLPATSTERIIGGMLAVNEQRLRTSVASRSGTILALPHCGNWDHAGAWCSVTDAPFTTVAERLRPQSMYDRFVAFRESLGMEVLPLTGGERSTYRILIERLKAGGMLCLLADRDLSARGVDVEFFGATARMPAGPASLALRTGATLIPTTLSFRPDGWQVVFHPEVAHSDVATMTQTMADAFARAIAEHPADWHMFQRLWLDDLEPRTAGPSR
ncbi:MAG: phosphatidylinositol mannoside acyltransferase [Actinobacteria bacterium]|nr:phosphatidylinositol mannoside acyltransferase [Actinomycetota bacterium]MBW3647347.1 phosphatidylinositol mannoside acyltransferase [Actinomycetota bacterium]